MSRQAPKLSVAMSTDWSSKRDPASNACRTDFHPFLEKIMSRQAPKLSVAMSTDWS
ncbi:hypothetical protein AVEN_129163-1, partial [Araneus ventricosus]